MFRITDRRAVKHRRLICGCGQPSDTKDDPQIISESSVLHHELRRTPALSTETFKSASLSSRESVARILLLHVQTIISLMETWALHLRNVADLPQKRKVSLLCFCLSSAGTDSKRRPLF